MLYLIGLGLNEESLGIEALEIIKKCNHVYLENYTVNFPYDTKDLLKIIGKKSITGFDRGEVESDRLIKEAKKEDICLLIYGSPLFATTHLTLLNDAKKAKVETKVVYNASVFDAIAVSGLELYKFGKITSMPKWEKYNGRDYKPDSFIDVVRENLSIKAHSLILCDIGLSFDVAVKQLREAFENKKFNLKNKKIVVCSQLGTKNENIAYAPIEDLLNKKFLMPFCIIIPSDLHFMEKEWLESL